MRLLFHKMKWYVSDGHEAQEAVDGTASDTSYSISAHRRGMRHSEDLSLAELPTNSVETIGLKRLSADVRILLRCVKTLYCQDFPKRQDANASLDRSEGLAKPYLVGIAWSV